jgi:hypothetical protein
MRAPVIAGESLVPRAGARHKDDAGEHQQKNGDLRRVHFFK